MLFFVGHQSSKGHPVIHLTPKTKRTMDETNELSRDIHSLLDPSHCTNSTFNALFVEQPSEVQSPPSGATTHEAYTPSSCTPKRMRVEEASRKRKVLLCFFPNTQATSALMETKGYNPKYEMIVPVRENFVFQIIIDFFFGVYILTVN